MLFYISIYLSIYLCLSLYLSLPLYLSAAGSEHRFLAVGIDFRWREIALLAAALVPLAYLAAELGPLARLI